MMAILDRSPIQMSTRTHPHPDVRIDTIVNAAWTKWKLFVPDSKVYRAIVRDVKREMDMLVQQSVLPALPQRNPASYAVHLSDEAKRLWTELHKLAPSLNQLTGQRIARKCGRK